MAISIDTAQVEKGNLEMTISDRLSVDDYMDFKRALNNVGKTSRVHVTLRNINQCDAVGLCLLMNLKEYASNETISVDVQSCIPKVELFLSTPEFSQFAKIA
ncbi:MAG: hypothetical protein OEX00_07615 [Gammaproteobacteria bacterium]|nr:hypothetical protein [Gammaproteobacteria bacterium]MDH5692677.1 hypothetical protein [Gammaproteobacteria bacterium]